MVLVYLLPHSWFRFTGRVVFGEKEGEKELIAMDNREKDCYSDNLYITVRVASIHEYLLPVLYVGAIVLLLTLFYIWTSIVPH